MGDCAGEKEQCLAVRPKAGKICIAREAPLPPQGGAPAKEERCCSEGAGGGLRRGHGVPAQLPPERLRVRRGAALPVRGGPRRAGRPLR